MVLIYLKSDKYNNKFRNKEYDNDRDIFKFHSKNTTKAEIRSKNMDKNKINPNI